MSTSCLVEVGQPAPAFTLEDQYQKPRSLADFAGRWLVLYFYPKDDTPGCTTEACDFRDAWPRVEAAGPALAGVSPDPAARHARFAAKHDVPFPLLADSDTIVCQAYGVWQEKLLYGRRFMGVVRTTYLIDPRGQVAHRWDRVRVKGHVEEVLDVAASRRG